MLRHYEKLMDKKCHSYRRTLSERAAGRAGAHRSAAKKQSLTESIRLKGPGLHRSAQSSPSNGARSQNRIAAHKNRSVSMPHACNRDSGINLELLFRCAHSRRRGECRYWSGWSSSSFTASSNEVTAGTTGPHGASLPQFGLPFLPIHYSFTFCTASSGKATGFLVVRQAGTLGLLRRQLVAELLLLFTTPFGSPGYEPGSLRVLMIHAVLVPVCHRESIRPNDGILAYQAARNGKTYQQGVVWPILLNVVTRSCPLSSRQTVIDITHVGNVGTIPR